MVFRVMTGVIDWALGPARLGAGKRGGSSQGDLEGVSWRRRSRRKGLRQSLEESLLQRKARSAIGFVNMEIRG